MLSIGRALMTHPQLIVLDEATEGLAPLIVDRDYRRVLAHADQALVPQKGQVVLQGTADEVAGSAGLSNYRGLRGLAEFFRGKCGGSPREIYTCSYQFRSE